MEDVLSYWASQSEVGIELGWKQIFARTGGMEQKSAGTGVKLHGDGWEWKLKLWASSIFTPVLT